MSYEAQISLPNSLHAELHRRPCCFGAARVEAENNARKPALPRCNARMRLKAVASVTATRTFYPPTAHVPGPSLCPSPPHGAVGAEFALLLAPGQGREHIHNHAGTQNPSHELEHSQLLTELEA